MGAIGMPKQEPEANRMIAAFPIQSDSASSAIPSNAALQDAHETFRQRWQAIVGGLHVSDEPSGGDAPAADSLRWTGAAISGKEPTAVAANEGRAIKDTAMYATGELVPRRASTANSTTSRPLIVLQTSAVPDAARLDSSHHPAKGRTDGFTSHARRSSRRCDQSAIQKQNTRTPSRSMTAPYSEPMILRPGARSGISLANEKTPQPALAAAAFLNRNGSLPGHPAFDLADSATGSAPSSGVGRPQETAENMPQPGLSSAASLNRNGNLPGHPAVDLADSATDVTPHPGMDRPQTSIEAADVSEERDAPASLSSQRSPVRTNEASVNPDPLAYAQKPTAGVEQVRPAIPDEPSLRAPYDRQSSQASASENFIKPSEAMESIPDGGAQIKQTPIAPSKTETAKHDRTAIGEVPLSSAAKPVRAPFILNQADSDAGGATFGQTRGGPLPSSTAVWTTPSSGLDAPAASTGKTASVQGPFVAMDAGRNDGAARWIVADSHRAEAGFQDPSLGWVSVRAQAGTAGIHAAVMPASEAAAEVLSGHLAGLNAHMANHYEHMNAVTVSAPGVGWNSHGTGRELAQGNGRGASHDGEPQGQENSGPIQAEPVRQFTNSLMDERATTELPVFTAGVNPWERHISVVA
jgi:hypothetical protein